MSATMRAAVVTRFGEHLDLRDVPVPVPKHGQVLVRVRACGVCHTDLHTVHGDWPDKPTLPRIPGHEAVGEVVAVGPGARDETGKLVELSVKAGDRVLFGKWSGSEVKIDGEELLIMKESDILGIVETEASSK